METKRVKEFHKYGTHFFGNLVVVDYTEDMNNDPKAGTWNSGLTFDYLEKAEALVQETYGKLKKVLLAIPEYVCEIE